MAKTIKEIAEELYPVNEEDSIDIKCSDASRQLACIKGANAVLEEIYGVFNNIFKGVRKGEVTTVNQVINPILERMKELKGE